MRLRVRIVTVRLQSAERAHRHSVRIRCVVPCAWRTTLHIADVPRAGQVLGLSRHLAALTGGLAGPHQEARRLQGQHDLIALSDGAASHSHGTLQAVHTLT